MGERSGNIFLFLFSKICTDTVRFFGLVAAYPIDPPLYYVAPHCSYTCGPLQRISMPCFLHSNLYFAHVIIIFHGSFSTCLWLNGTLIRDSVRASSS